MDPGAKKGLLGRSFQPQGRGQQALAAVEDNELVRQKRLILIRFQDETNGGKVSAWQDHAGLIYSS
jgi:hypothetical protein